MVDKIDNFLTAHGFDACELKSVGHRGYFYAAVSVEAAFAAAMIAVAAHQWLV